MRGNRRGASTTRSSAAIASAPAVAPGISRPRGTATLSTAAQPNDSARCTGTAAVSSGSVRCSRGRRIDPAAVAASSRGSPRSSVTVVDGTPLSRDAAAPAASASASATVRVVSDAYVALMLIHLHFPDSASLKGKRKDLMSVKAQLHGRYGVTVAEVDGQDTWQRSTLAAALTAGSLSSLDAAVDRVERYLLDRFPETVRVERTLTSFEDAGGLG
jgi:uncharacterized protein YlxP (DUF503 family)